MGQVISKSPNPYEADKTNSRYTPMNEYLNSGNVVRGLFRGSGISMGAGDDVTLQPTDRTKAIATKHGEVGSLVSFGNDVGYIIEKIDDVAVLVQRSTYNLELDPSFALGDSKILIVLDHTADLSSMDGKYDTLINAQDERLDYVDYNLITSDPRTWSDIAVSTELYQRSFVNAAPPLFP